MVRVRNPASFHSTCNRKQYPPQVFVRKKTMSDNICPIAPGVPHQSLSQVCLHFQSQLQSLWLALLRQLRIFLQAVDTALCQEVRWPKKIIKKLHVTQGQPVSSGLWMTSSYSFFKKIQWFVWSSHLMALHCRIIQQFLLLQL